MRGSALHRPCIDMTPQQFVGVALRLLALWLVLSAVRYFFAIPAALAQYDMAERTVYSYSTGIAYIVAALPLWFFPMWLAGKLLPKTRFEHRLNLQPLEAIRVGCALIGLWVFANAAPNLAWFFLRAVLFNPATSAFNALDAQAKLDIAVALFELGLSLVLIFRAGPFASMVEGVAFRSVHHDESC